MAAESIEHPAGKPPEQRSRLENRFWSKVDIRDDDECWEWQACLDKHGYGRFWMSTNNRSERAHRVSYQLVISNIPDGKQINHECDNPRCVNPQHLYAGTQGENVEDAHRRTRDDQDGTDMPHGLSADTVRNIRREYATGDWSYEELADEYDVGSTTIGRIIRRERYTDLD